MNVQERLAFRRQTRIKPGSSATATSPPSKAIETQSFQTNRFEEDVTTMTEADAYEWSWSPAAEAKMAVLRLAAEC
jgi:hypothetical protein